MLWKKSNAAVFDELLRPHLDHLYRLAYRLTGSVADAEDLVQDVLVKLFPRLEELRAIEILRPWLARVLTHQFIDRARSHARTPFGHRDELGIADGEEDPLDGLPGDAPDPADVVDQAQNQGRLLAAFGRLSEEHRAVLALHEMEGYSLVEIEQMLSTPIGTLKSRLHRARQQLKSLLQREPIEEFRRVDSRGQEKWTVVK